MENQNQIQFIDEDDEIIDLDIVPQRKVLIYGRVQSGKTARIMQYIKESTISVKLLFIQNSLSMLSQYNIALKQNNIKCFIVSNPNIFQIIQHLELPTQNVVLIVMNNTYRRSILDEILSRGIIHNYLLIMDESDLYHDYIRVTQLYQNASECVHVTATPFTKEYKNYFDEVIVIKPKDEYIGFDKLDITLIPDVDTIDMQKHIINITNNDFMSAPKGILLINVHSRINKMKELCTTLSRKKNLVDVPIVMLSSNSILHYNNKTKDLKKMTVSQIISGLEEHSHIILVANRLSTRGINFSNLTYDRHLTHQIIIQNQNKTNFIQRCRILGNKVGVKDKLKLYCLNCDELYFDEVLKRINKVESSPDDFKVMYENEEGEEEKQRKRKREEEGEEEEEYEEDEIIEF
jgi:hypothetical protein